MANDRSFVIDAVLTETTYGFNVFLLDDFEIVSRQFFHTRFAAEDTGEQWVVNGTLQTN